MSLPRFSVFCSFSIPFSAFCFSLCVSGQHSPLSCNAWWLLWPQLLTTHVSSGLSYPVFKGIMKKGYKVPTPIQRKVRS